MMRTPDLSIDLDTPLPAKSGTFGPLSETQVKGIPQSG